MIKVKRIDHVGLVTSSLAEMAPLYGLLGLPLAFKDEMPEKGLKAEFYSAGETKLEVLEPSNNSSLAGKHLESKGEGVSHVCIAVENIEEAIAELKAAGYKMLNDKPMPSMGDCRVAYMDPQTIHGLMLELMEENPK